MVRSEAVLIFALVFVALSLISENVSAQEWMSGTNFSFSSSANWTDNVTLNFQRKWNTTDWNISWISYNASGVWQNDTMPNNTLGVAYFNITLAGTGPTCWDEIGWNNTNNFGNRTGQQCITIYKAPSNSTLYVNGGRTGITTTPATSINITVVVNVTGTYVNISTNISGWLNPIDATDDSRLQNLTTFPAGVLYNITGFVDNANVSFSSDTIIINSSSFPTIFNASMYPSNRQSLEDVIMLNETYTLDADLVNDTQLFFVRGVAGKKSGACDWSTMYNFSLSFLSGNSYRIGNDTWKFGDGIFCVNVTSSTILGENSSYVGDMRIVQVHGAGAHVFYVFNGIEIPVKDVKVKLSQDGSNAWVKDTDENGDAFFKSSTYNFTSGSFSIEIVSVPDGFIIPSRRESNWQQGNTTMISFHIEKAKTSVISSNVDQVEKDTSWWGMIVELFSTIGRGFSSTVCSLTGWLCQ